MRHVRSWLQAPLSFLIFAMFQHLTTAQDNCDGVCGRRPLAPSHGGQTRIIGGSDTLPGTWPWMVSFCKVWQVKNKPRYAHFCGGSLISSRWVLSAAHCFVKQSNISDIRAIIGITTFTVMEPSTHIISLNRVINHQFYRKGENNDISLIELSKSVHCSDYIQPACLPDEDVDVPSLSHCYISGWGITNTTTKTRPRTLKEARVDLIPTEICNSSGWLHMLITPDCLCAGFEQGGVDTCQGDSGGPLMCREARSERFWVVGITSFGSGCGNAKKPGVYTATQDFIGWITYESGQNFYKPTQRPVALAESQPKPATTVSRPQPLPQPQPPVRPQPQPQPPPSPVVVPQPQPQPPVHPQPQPQPRPPPPVLPQPQPPPQPTSRPQPQTWPQPIVRPHPQPQPAQAPVRPQPQPTIRPQPPPSGQDNKCRGPCGIRPKAPSHGGPAQVGGGTNALPGTWPWLVSIQLPEGNGFRHWCGGSLISSRWVLTAAHCFVLKRFIRVTHWRVLAGVTDLSQPGPDAQILSIKRLVEHERYHPIGQLNDIALIELDPPVTCNDYVQPACLPDDSVKIPTLSICFFSGWSTTDANRYLKKPKILQEVRVNLLEIEACNSSRWYHKRIKGNNLCALAEKAGKENCRGDGGAPLMCREQRSERFWVVGTNSWGSGCTRERMTEVFAATKYFFSWIQGITKGTYQAGSQSKPSVTQLPNWRPSSARPRPTFWSRPRPHYSFDRPNYVPMHPPHSQLPTRPPKGYSRPHLGPKPSLQQWSQWRPALQAHYNKTQWRPWSYMKPQSQPAFPGKPQQFQNWTQGWPSVIHRKPRPRAHSRRQSQGWARIRL